MTVKHSVTYSEKVDFIVDNRYNFEIGGKNKSQKQLDGLPEAFLAVDNICKPNSTMAIRTNLLIFKFKQPQSKAKKTYLWRLFQNKKKL